MERIVYRKTLDVHKNGTQFLLQGFETADNMSRIIEINLMASGDAIDLPLERVAAMMYVTTPGATEPSINKCTIKDNTIIYDVLPITEEGITTMQLKLIESKAEGASSVLAAPKFAVEVTKSDADDSDVVQSTTFTALEDAIAMAMEVYDKACIGIELTSDCIFRAKYNDGSYYESDLLKELFVDGTVKLSQSYAVGGTGTRAGEDTDNSKYYSNVARSEALNAKNIMENSEEILKEMQKHGVYTSFSVDFETGEVEYVSPSVKFNINNETGKLDVEGKAYTFEDVIGEIVSGWLVSKGIEPDAVTLNANNIEALQAKSVEHSGYIKTLQDETKPIEKGGTGATTKDEALTNLGALSTIVVKHSNSGANEDIIEFDKKPLLVIFPEHYGIWDKFVVYGQNAAKFSSGTASNFTSHLSWGKNENGKHYLKITHAEYSELKYMSDESIVVIVDNSDV